MSGITSTSRTDPMAARAHRATASRYSAVLALASTDGKARRFRFNPNKKKNKFNSNEKKKKKRKESVGNNTSKLDRIE